MYLLAAYAAIAIALVAGSYFKGRADAGEACAVAAAKREAELVALKAKQAAVTTRLVTEYKDRVRVVKEKGDEIVKEVMVYVPVADVLPSGWRVFHDAAASGVMPESPERAIAAAAPVEAVAAASTVAENYQACRATREQLIALQKWSVEVSKGVRE